MDPADRRRLEALMDVHEGRGGVPLLSTPDIVSLLHTSRRIAMVGASDRPGRPSRGVMEDLLARGYEVVPVTPVSATVLGIPAYPDLAAATGATGPFDIVDVFRRAEDCVPHAREAVAAGARVLWLQLGIANWEAARIAHEAGLGVVMDRCLSIELRRLPRR